MTTTLLIIQQTLREKAMPPGTPLEASVLLFVFCCVPWETPLASVDQLVSAAEMVGVPVENKLTVDGVPVADHGLLATLFPCGGPVGTANDALVVKTAQWASALGPRTVAVPWQPMSVCPHLRH